MSCLEQVKEGSDLKRGDAPLALREKGVMKVM